MTYKNFPVYIGHGNREFTSDWGYHKDHMIYANRVNVNFNTSKQPNRRLGCDVDNDNQFVYTSDLVCDLDFDFFFYSYPRSGDGGDSIYGFLFDDVGYDGGYVVGNGSGLNYFPIKVGGNFYNKCYLENLSIDATPMQPVRCNVKFKCYSPPENVSTDFDESVPYANYDEWASGNGIINSHNCELSGVYDGIVYSDVINRLSYTKNYRTTPVYTLGSVKPTSFLIDAIESQLDLESTGLVNIFDYSGTKLGNDVGFRILDSVGDGILDTYNGGYDVVVGSGAVANSQSYSINGGDVILSKLSIQEVIL